jgi:hypothetical protein
VQDTAATTTWNVISNLKDLQDFAPKIPVDSKGFTANIPSRDLIPLFGAPIGEPHTSFYFGAGQKRVVMDGPKVKESLPTPCIRELDAFGPDVISRAAFETHVRVQCKRRADLRTGLLSLLKSPTDN